MQVAVLDADGYAACPDCGTRVKCGRVGLANLEKRHQNSDACKNAQEKHKKKENKRIQAYLITLKGPKRLRCPQRSYAQSLFKAID